MFSTIYSFSLCFLLTNKVQVAKSSQVLFNADTFDILNMGGGFGQLCSRANLPANDLDGVASIFDLSKTTGPSSFGASREDTNPDGILSSSIWYSAVTFDIHNIGILYKNHIYIYTI